MDELFFWLSKIVWLFIAPDSFLIIWLGMVTVLLFFGAIVWSKRMLITLYTLVFIVALFPVGEWLFYPLEREYKQPEDLTKVDGVVVLSGSVYRDLAFIKLARKFPNAKLLSTGGSPSMIYQDEKSTDFARDFFIEQEMDVSRILFERNSRNTWENAVFSKSLVDPKIGEKWVLITTAWHMKRSVDVFCKVGWEVIPYPVDFKANPDQLFRLDWNFSSHLNQLVFSVKEWIGIIAYKISGKSC